MTAEAKAGVGLGIGREAGMKYEFGMIACAVVMPFALVAGHFRGIPIGWRLIDCAFKVVGFVPLWLARRMVAVDSGTVA